MAEAHELLIGIGNPLRGDDGVGWWLAQRVGNRWPTAAVRLVQQLTPELADELVTVRRVLFLDAWLPSDPTATLHEPCLQRLEAATDAELAVFSHHGDPAQLLAITALLHGRLPQAWQLLVPAFRCGHGPGLSPPLRRLLPRAITLLNGWLDLSRSGSDSAEQPGSPARIGCTSHPWLGGNSRSGARMLQDDDVIDADITIVNADPAGVRAGDAAGMDRFRQIRRRHDA